MKGKEKRGGWFQLTLLNKEITAARDVHLEHFDEILPFCLKQLKYRPNGPSIFLRRVLGRDQGFIRSTLMHRL